MKLPHRRQFLHLAAGAAALPFTPCIAKAQTYPTRPVTMVVPFGAGGSVDVIGRVFATRLSEVLGKPIIVENIVGSGGMAGVSRVVKAAPDGYQFVLGTVGTHAYNQTLYKKPLYNAATDFAPVALIAESPIVLIVRNDLPAGNLHDFITYAKANQARMQYGSAGAGSGSHISCVLLNSVIGLNITHIPYRSSPLAMQDMIAGLIDYQCPTVTAAIPQIQGNQVTPIAIFTKNRSPPLPALPSAHEQGLANFEANNWYAFFLPKGTPVAIVQKLNDAVRAVMNIPVVQAKLLDIGATVIGPERRSTEYLQKFVMSEIETWAGPIKASGVSMD
jgi:tripartite-type tricarboxylate transporter receptor subunit TctC